jgi:hypothetical protein
MLLRPTDPAFYSRRVVAVFIFYYPRLGYGNLTHTISRKLEAMGQGTVSGLRNLHLNNVYVEVIIT